MTKRNLFVLALALAVMPLVACGGGSVSGPDPVVPTPTPTPNANPSVRFVSITPPAGSILGYNCQGSSAHVSIAYDLGNIPWDETILVGAGYSVDGIETVSGIYHSTPGPRGTTPVYTLCMTATSIHHTESLIALLVRQSGNQRIELARAVQPQNPYDFQQ